MPHRPKVLFVANPRSRSGTSDLAAIRAAVERHADIVDACMPGDDLATRGGDADRIVVAGGDGSVGCAAARALDLELPLGVVPAGTANDFARANALPLDPIAAAELAAVRADPAGRIA